MPTLFDGTWGIDDIVVNLDRMEANCPQPSSKSKHLWELRRATNIASHNRSKETMLERAVAMLADNGHMPGWFNQCPTASGIGDSARDRHSSVDLAHWRASDGRLSLVELKWESDSPSEAVRQILRYGAAYLFCRMHRDRLPIWNRRAISATHVALRIAAPRRYYAGESLRDCLFRARESLAAVPQRTGLSGLSMSLDAFAFPGWFNRLPFTDGAEVRDSCDKRELTERGREIVDAFYGLTSV